MSKTKWNKVFFADAFLRKQTNKRIEVVSSWPLFYFITTTVIIFSLIRYLNTKIKIVKCFLVNKMIHNKINACCSCEFSYEIK